MDQFAANISLLFQFPVVNLKIVLDGVMIGALFALAAYGLALVWGVMNVKNLAQGDFVIAGGYVCWWLSQQGIPALLGVPAAFIVMAAIGWIIYRVIICRVIDRDLFTTLLATFGLAIMMAQILNLLFGSDTQSVSLGFDTLYFMDGFIDVPIAKLIGVLMAGTLAAGVIVFMKYSRMGQAIRATAQDARAARVLGIAPLGFDPEAVKDAADTLVHAAWKKLFFCLGPMRKHPLIVNHQYVTIAHHGKHSLVKIASA